MAVGLVLTVGCGTGTETPGPGEPEPTTFAPPEVNPANTARFGERHTFPDQTSVEVSAPRACTSGHTRDLITDQPIERIVTFDVTVVNGADRPAEAGVTLLGVEAWFKGERVERLIDSANPDCDRAEGGVLAPGASTTGTVSFPVGAEPAELRLDLTSGLDGARVHYLGTA